MPTGVIQSFSISSLEILSETGQVDASLEPNLSETDLLRLYRAMVLAREADTRMLKLQRQGRIGTFALCTGQEAAAVGAAFAMGPKDWLVGSFREVGARLVRGEPFSTYLLGFNGYEEGNLHPAESDNRVLPVSVIVAGQTLHAVGLAYAAKYRKERSAVVVFFGDGATSEGDFHEAMNFASVWKVPVVFVCANNQWAISVPKQKQTASETIAQKAIAYGMPSIRVDGNDALAMYQATHDALVRAYDGGGPTLIEGLTYRLMMHTTADDPRKYRSEDEEQRWWQREPLKRFRIYLENKGLWNDQREQDMMSEVREEIDGQVKQFEARTHFPPETPFEHVYGTEHAEIAKQKQQFMKMIQRPESSHG